MHNENFFPDWYIKQKNSKKNIIMNVFIIIMFIFNFTITIRISVLFNQKRNEKFKIKEVVTIIQGKENNKIDLCLENYKNFYEFCRNNEVSCEEYYLDCNNMIANIKVENKDEYVNKIKILEGKYTIKSLSIPMKDKENYRFRVEIRFNDISEGKPPISTSGEVTMIIKRKLQWEYKSPYEVVNFIALKVMI